MRQNTLFWNSIFLMLATGVMAGFGFFFWLINTRLFTTAEIGIATALISVMMLIATLSLLGFNAAFVRFLPGAADKNEQMNTGLILVSLATIVIALFFIALVAHISPQLIFIQQNPWYALIFILACVMTALNILTDAVFLAGKRTVYTLVIDALFSAFKMIAPFAFIGFGVMGIFSAAALAQTLGTGLSIAAMMRHFDYRPSFVVDTSVIRHVWRYCAANYFAGILNLLPVTLLPLIIINNLGAASAAYYYIAFMIANLLYAIPYSTTRSLFAEGSNDETSLVDHSKKSIWMIALMLVPAIAVLYFGGGIILHVFGKEYSESGLGFLRELALAGVVVSAYSLVNAIFQVRREISAVIIVNIVFAASIIMLSYAFLPLGLSGIGLAWIMGNWLAALVGYALFEANRYLLPHWEHLTYARREQIRCAYYYARAWLGHGGTTKSILFYPEKPRQWHVLYPICHLLGYRISNDPAQPYDAVVAFSDITVRPDYPVLRELSADHEVINLNCLDISKTCIEDVFREIFGYGMAIDPRTATGPYVRKSNTNATHDGIILDAPSEPQDGYVYQKLINNVEDGRARDIRAMIFKDSIPFTLYRYKSLSDRFDATILAEWADTDEALSKKEQADIIRFCERIGMDYGELDIVRDVDDGRIYILDANNTPSGPHRGSHMPAPDYDRFLTTLARSFAEAFLKS